MALPLVMITVGTHLERAMGSDDWRVNRPVPMISEFSVESIDPSQDLKTATLKGRYTGTASTLVLGNTKLILGKDGEFSTIIPFAGKEAELFLLLIDDYGKQTRERMILEPKSTPERTPTMLSLGLLYTSITYQESLLPPYQETAVTLKGGLNRSISKKWDASLGGYYTALPLKNDQNTTARFLGVNFRIGFTPSPASRTRFTLYGGGYYTTTQVEGDRFGFKNMSGPQILPMLTHEFGSQQQMSTYIKYSPVSNRFTSLSFGNREIAGGLAYTWKKKNLKSVSAGIDYADINITFPQASQSLNIHSRSFSGGLTFGW